MYHQLMTKHKPDIKIELSPYKNDIRKIFETMINEDTTNENYNLYKDDFDIFINNIIGKLIIVNTPPVEIIYDEPMLIDKTIYIKPKSKMKSVLGLMKKNIIV